MRRAHSRFHDTTKKVRYRQWLVVLKVTEGCWAEGRFAGLSEARGKK